MDIIKLRIGADWTFDFAVGRCSTNGTPVPEDFSDATDLSVSVTGADFQKVQIPTSDIAVTGNIIRFSLLAANQTKTGRYVVTVTYKRPDALLSERQYVVDAVFEFVDKSYLQNDVNESRGLSVPVKLAALVDKYRGEDGHSPYINSTTETWYVFNDDTQQWEDTRTPARGPAGPQGIAGPIGSQGPAGATGATGPKGQRGEQGPQGEKGPMGAAGATGPKGERGEQGPTGSEGPAGATGPKGDTGERGPIGPEGPQGPKGDVGAQGPKGDKGDIGERGPKGDKGDIGPQGQRGEKGDKGDKGEQGAPGESISPGCILSYQEQVCGKLVVGGFEHDLYRRLVQLSDLPSTAGATVEYTVDSDPLGNSLYLTAGNLVVRDAQGNYLPSGYSVSKIYVTDDIITKLILVCDTAIENPQGATALVTLEYIKSDRVSLELTLPEGASADQLAMQMPPLKYGKKFAYSYTFDDDVVQAYGKAFCTINKKWVDDEKLFHVGQAKTTGTTPSKTLGYTDGCGNERRFTFGVALWPNWGSAYIDNFMNPNKAADRYYPYLVWNDLVPLLDFGNSIYFHNVDERVYDKTNAASIAEGLRADQRTVLEKIGRGVKVLVRPDGNDEYITAGRASEDIVLMTTEGGNADLNSASLSNVELYKKVQHRRYTEPIKDATALMENITAAAGADHFPWLHDFSHAPAEFQYILDLFTAINDRYGKDGDDTVWFASVDEVYEYWFTRRYSRIKKEVSGNKVIFSIYIPSLKYGYYRDFSAVLSGLTDLTGVSIQAPGNDVYGLSYGTSAGGVLVNLNCNKQLAEMAEKYTAKFEASEDAADKEDALYFINQLKTDLQAPYLARINVSATAPILNSVSINSGAQTTYELLVQLSLNVTGNITHYRAAEASDLTGTGWEAGTSKTISFTLSAEYGAKTVYVQVKNEHGESEVKSAVITLEERPAVTYTVRGLSSNSDHGTVSPATQEVAEGGSASLTAAAKSGYLIGSWSGATTGTGAGTTSGTATIENVRENVTVICNFIEETPPQPAVNKTVICFNTAASVEGVNAVNSYTTEVSCFNSAGALSFRYIRQDTPFYDSSVYYANETPGAPYPYEVYMKPLAGYSKTIDGSDKKALVFRAINPSGKYKVRLYCNTKNANTASYADMVYAVNGVQKSPTFPVMDNVDNFLEFEDVECIDGDIKIEIWATKAWTAVVINVIEIEKI